LSGLPRLWIPGGRKRSSTRSSPSPRKPAVGSDFLARVRRLKERELGRRMAALPEEELLRRAAEAPPARPFGAALLGGYPAVIAEVKRRYPSAGPINAIPDPAALAEALARGGASAISVLTEENHFGGSLEELRRVRERVSVPVLRKDFLVDPWELFEARAAGADAVLLIVALLGPGQLATMLDAAAAIGLECLVEVHDDPELEAAVLAGARIIGINNRDLRTLQVDLGTALRLAPLIPAGIPAVGESGYRTPGDIREGVAAGLSAFLVGESFMRAADPAAAVRHLLGVAP
jgi:indole-3-glycerol phosphate synthase